MNTYLFMGLTLLTPFLFAQDTDSLLNPKIPILKEIILSDDKLSRWAIGSSVQDLGASPNGNGFSSLASLLSNKSHIRIRSYGAGGLSSASFRGAAASHTQIFWNGLALNLPTTGQQDLSLLPVLFIDKLEVQSGGLSSLLGEGVLGGSIHLQNTLDFNSGHETNLHFSFGSFGKQISGLRSKISDIKNAFDVRLYSHSANNNYPYNDPYSDGEKKDLEHASFISKGLQTSYARRFNSRWSAHVRYWRQETDRELAPTISEAQSTAEQRDESDILLIHINHNKNDFEWNAHISYQYSDLRYEDLIKTVFSNHKTHRYKVNQDFYWRFSEKEVLRFESSLQVDKVKSTNFDDAIDEEIRFTTSLNHRKYLTKNVLLVSGARQEFFDHDLSPFLPSLSFQFKLNPSVWLAYSGSRSYKRPSWNDRYWKPGGNPDLLEEMGWMSNLSIVYETTKVDAEKRISLSAYHGRIKNWITWLPSAEYSYWIPQNKASVEQKGLELEGRFSFHKSWGSLCYESSISCQRVNDLNAELTNAKQLMYIPIYQANQKFSWERESVLMYYQHHYESKRYTSADHNSYMDAYALASIGIEYSNHLNNKPIILGFQVDNLWDSNYQMVQNRPMPGRHFNLTINFLL